MAFNQTKLLINCFIFLAKTTSRYIRCFPSLQKHFVTVHKE